MRWTSRLRHHGGLRAIAARRVRQFRLLAAVPIYARQAKAAADAKQWLAESPLRVLNAAEEDYFTPSWSIGQRR